MVSLASAASSGATALYVSQGTPPTPYNYQEAADVANQPNQTAVVPQVLDGGHLLHPGPERLRQPPPRPATRSRPRRPAALTVSGISPAVGRQRRQRHHRNRRHQLHAVRHGQPDPRQHHDQRLGHRLRQRQPDLRHLQPDRGGRRQLHPESAARAPSRPPRRRRSRWWPPAPAPLQRRCSARRSTSAPGRTGTIVITYTNPTNNDIVAPLLDIVVRPTPSVSFSTAGRSEQLHASRRRSWPWPPAGRRASCGPARAASSR